MWTTYKTLLFFIPPLARILFQVPWHVTKRDDNATAQSWGASDSSEQLNYDKNAFRFIICFISLKTKFSCVYWINFSSNESHKSLPDTFPPFMFWVIDCRRLLRIRKSKAVHDWEDDGQEMHASPRCQELTLFYHLQ